MYTNQTVHCMFNSFLGKGLVGEAFQDSNPMHINQFGLGIADLAINRFQFVLHP